MPDPLTFVDTNVLLYAHDRDAGDRHDQAVRIVDQLWEHGTGALSTQVLQEFYVNATRKLARTIGRAEARDIVADYATWRVHQVSVRDVVDASSLEEQHTLSSEDLQTGRGFGALTVANPFGGPP